MVLFSEVLRRAPVCPLLRGVVGVFSSKRQSITQTPELRLQMKKTLPLFALLHCDIEEGRKQLVRTGHRP